MARSFRNTVHVRESTGSRAIEQSKIRLLCVGMFFVLCYGTIGIRLVEMMITSLSATLSQKTEEGTEPSGGEEDTRVASRNVRGDIVDRNGVLLATSLRTESAFANPKEIKDIPLAAEKLSRALRMDKDVLLRQMRGGKSFVWIKRHLTPSEQEAVNTLGIPGVYFLPEQRRIYPYANELAHVLGYVGVDSRGLAGIEKTFDLALSESDPRVPLKLSIDMRIQHMLRDEMRKAVEEFKAIGAAGIVADVKTGEVIAMSSLPDFDPHVPSKATDVQKFNRAALGIYEMGSTFKSFTMAMALDSGKVSIRDGFDATNPLKYASFTISDAHGKKRWLNVPEIYAYSSNIGTAKIALLMGSKAQRKFLDKIGMMSPLQMEIPERAVPIFPSEWKDINTITISYGHGISVSPLHLVRGIATLVNGGTLPTLTLVRRDEQANIAPPRVISERTSEYMRKLMRLVVKHGTGGKADIAGYRVGGKTGTAEKINASGKYNDNAKLSSFIGTFPVDDPKYVVLVMIDEPVGNKATYGYSTGGWVAAPAVGNVIARMAPMYGIRPVFDPQADDADKYWVDSERKNVQTVKAVKPSMPNAAFDARYVHAIAY